MTNLILNIKEIYKHGYTAIDRITGYPFQKKKFYKRHGYLLDLKNPTTFNEKIVWKKINDRNPLLPLTADKHRVREYIVEKLGEKDAKEVLIPLLYVTDNLKTIPFDKLPKKYIIKSNFGSGQNLIIDENSTYTKKEIINKCKKWLQKSYGVMYHEWAYQKIERKIVIEELLLDENGNIPKDYKFFVFNGKCEIVQVDSDRFEESARTLTLYTREWKIIPATKSMQKQGNEISKPLAYTRMLELAELLGKNFDFVRVDLYAIKDNIYFGEMTHYPKSGMGKFTPQSFDLALGQKWRIAPRYWE